MQLSFLMPIRNHYATSYIKITQLIVNFPQLKDKP
jgi:hypothetical protein